MMYPMRNETHDHWQDQLAFYVAGSLPPVEAQALEAHLATCSACRQAVEDWRRIATGVQAEASSWSVKLPPLAPDVRAAVAQGATVQQRPGSARVYQYDAGDDVTMPLPRMAARRTAPIRRGWNAVAMAAAVLTLVLFGGVFMFLANQNQANDRTATQVALGAAEATDEATRELTREATQQASADATGEGTPLPEPSATRIPDLGIQLAGPTNTPGVTDPPTQEHTPRPSATPLPPPAGTPSAVPTTGSGPAFSTSGQCVIGVAGSDPVTLYRWPDTAAPSTGNLQPGQTYGGSVQSANGWYQVVSPMGWAPASALQLSPECAMMPYPTATAINLDFCMGQSATGATLTTWFGPGEATGVAGSVGGSETIPVIGQTGTGWYQVNVLYAAPFMVWVRAADLTLLGACDSLPVVPWDGRGGATTTPTPTPAPQVQFFTADEDGIIRGGTAILRWSTSATRVWIEYYDANDRPGPNESYIPDGVYPELAPTGSLEVSIPADYPYDVVRFALIMDSYSYASRTTRAVVDLPVVASQAQIEMTASSPAP